MVIDANTGEVLLDTIGGALRDEADEVRASLREPQDAARVWPLADVAPPGPEVKYGNITYIEPDPSSGIFILPAHWDGDDSSGAGLFIHNGKSRMAAYVATSEAALTGVKVDMTRVLPDDRAAFERLAATIQVDRTQQAPWPLPSSWPR
jgi:hypothetical protein